MKKVLLYYAGMFILIMTIFSYSACTDTQTNDPESQNSREKFLGTWKVEETCIRLDYEVEITADENSSTRVFMDNFAFMGPDYAPAYGLANYNRIDMPEQTIGDNWVIIGTGTFQSNGTIRWTYSIKIGANASNCEAYFK